MTFKKVKITYWTVWVLALSIHMLFMYTSILNPLFHDFDDIAIYKNIMFFITIASTIIYSFFCLKEHLYHNTIWVVLCGSFFAFAFYKFELLSSFLGIIPDPYWEFLKTKTFMNIAFFLMSILYIFKIRKEYLRGNIKQAKSLAIFGSLIIGFGLIYINFF